MDYSSYDRNGSDFRDMLDAQQERDDEINEGVEKTTFANGVKLIIEPVAILTNDLKDHLNAACDKFEEVIVKKSIKSLQGKMPWITSVNGAN